MRRRNRHRVGQALSALAVRNLLTRSEAKTALGPLHYRRSMVQGDPGMPRQGLPQARSSGSALT